jgi:hypothetical protein
MQKLSCIQSFGQDFIGQNSRLLYVTQPGERPPEVKSKAEKPQEVPEAERLTQEHIEKVLRAVNHNISEVRRYYEDVITGEMKMPRKIKEQVAQLNSLRYQLESAKKSPAGARDVVKEIYDIFTKLDVGAKESQRNKDNLAPLDYRINRPTLAPAMTKAEIREAANAQVEAKERYDATLFNEGVKGLVSGEINQEQLDAVKAQFAHEKVKTLARSVTTERGIYDVYITLSPDGNAVNIKGVLETSIPKEGKTGQVMKADINTYQSLDSNKQKVAEFKTPSIEDLRKRVASRGVKKLEKIA